MNKLNTSDIRVPSGLDVESVTTHLTENRMLDDHTHDGGMKDKLYHLRSRGMRKWGSIKRDMNDRASNWKPVAQQRIVDMRSGVKSQIASLQGQMKSNPGKWAGIAAGAGLGIGLIGRIMRRRMRVRSEELPNIVIVGAC